jgi:hypothetical protein
VCTQEGGRDKDTVPVLWALPSHALPFQAEGQFPAPGWLSRNGRGVLLQGSTQVPAGDREREWSLAAGGIRNQRKAGIKVSVPALKLPRHCVGQDSWVLSKAAIPAWMRDRQLSQHG